ncbi:hypothetical protein HMPREF0262_01381 [Clostridium sp. ATCC 29733]|nr:hypothetical protein HMPREF0262_01381 [Clostridium sp. ATCC 29733]
MGRSPKKTRYKCDLLRDIGIFVAAGHPIAPGEAGQGGRGEK